MKQSKLLRFCFTVLLSVSVLFTVTVHEVHFLVSQHAEALEHCENHLHGSHEHASCTICKFNALLFTDSIPQVVSHSVSFCSKQIIRQYQSRASHSTLKPNTFRGPPLLSC